MHEHVEHLFRPCSAVDLRGRKFVLRDHFKTEIVLDVRLCRAVHHFRHEVRGDKQHAAARAVYNVAGQYRRLADAGDAVEVFHHKFSYRRRIDAAVIHLHAFHRLHLLGVADAAPYDAAARLCARFDRRRQVAAEEGALVNFVVHIHDDYVALGEAVDHPLIVIALSALRSAHAEHHFVQVGAGGNERRRDCPADEFAPVVVQRF